MKREIKKKIEFKICESVSLFRKSIKKKGYNQKPEYPITKRINEDTYEITKGDGAIRVNRVHLKSQLCGEGMLVLELCINMIIC